MSIRPNIKISPYISKQIKNEKTIFGIKFVNHTKVPITDVKIELRMLHSRNHDHGIVYEAKYLSLKKESFFEISEYNSDETNAFFATRVGIIDNLEIIWNEPQYQHLQLVIRATHSKSGFHNTVKMIYRSKNQDIVSGEHLTGTNLNISPDN